jgi:hypothetical protein
VTGAGFGRFLAVVAVVLFLTAIPAIGYVLAVVAALGSWIVSRVRARGRS